MNTKTKAALRSSLEQESKALEARLPEAVAEAPVAAPAVVADPAPEVAPAVVPAAPRPVKDTPQG